LNNRTKTITGVSVIGVIAIVFKLFHVAHTVDTVTKLDEPKMFRNAPVTIVITDSTGKRDTMRIEDYLKKNNLVGTDTVR
jgi:hypothetical protein